jgi:hypothetical protein
MAEQFHINLHLVSDMQSLFNEWRRLHNEELYDLYSSPNIIQVIKSKMKWAGHVARMEDRFWWGDLRERDHLEELGVDGKTSKWIFKRWDGGAWTGLLWLRIGTGGGLL